MEEDMSKEIRREVREREGWLSGYKSHSDWNETDRGRERGSG